MAGSPQVDSILAALKSSWDEEYLDGTKNSSNCSGFVKSVLTKLHEPFVPTANADGLMDGFASDCKALVSGVEAATKAAAGIVVVAGLKGEDHQPKRTHGHVAIVVGGELYRKTYPLCWCGSTGDAQSQGTKSVGEVWSRNDRDNVKYYYFE